MPHLTIDSRKDCYILDKNRMEAHESGDSSTSLEPGLYVIRISKGSFRYWTQDQKFAGEPWVLLWIFGGKFINNKTNVQVGASWSSLNGYDDTLTLEILETAKLCALFLDTYAEDNSGEVTLSIFKEA